MADQPGYYYLHTDGSLIWKNGVVVDNPHDYFESPFVRGWWRFDPSKRGDAWVLLLEASCAGASPERIAALARKWGINAEDAGIYCGLSGIELECNAPGDPLVISADGSETVELLNSDKPADVPVDDVVWALIEFTRANGGRARVAVEDE